MLLAALYCYTLLTFTVGATFGIYASYASIQRGRFWPVADMLLGGVYTVCLPILMAFFCYHDYRVRQGYCRKR